MTCPPSSMFFDIGNGSPRAQGLVTRAIYRGFRRASASSRGCPNSVRSCDQAIDPVMEITPDGIPASSGPSIRYGFRSVNEACLDSPGRTPLTRYRDADRLPELYECL